MQRAWRLVFAFALVGLSIGWPSTPARAQTAAPDVVGAQCPAGNLLAGKRPRQWVQIIGKLEQVTDGVVTQEGAIWDAPNAVKLVKTASSLSWDLGAVTTLQLAYIQADANDSYVVSGSLDGVSYHEIGKVDVVEGVHGLRARQVKFGGAQVRFVRFGGGLGDDFYSISEFQLFCQVPTPFPPALKVAQAPLAKGAGSYWTSWNDESSARWELLLALLGLGLLQWNFLLKRDGREQVKRKLRDVLLGTLGVLAALTYINFGSFHFGNFMHDWEWTHYYVGSKYFKELSYDRLYECMAIVDVEDGLRSRVEARKITNLRTNHLESTADVLAHPERCKDNFSPERWQSFKHDVEFFRARQPVKRWDDLQTDHGYNGTPVWNIAGTLLSNLGPASTGQLYTLAMLDPLYLLGMIAVVWWAFGWRTLSVALLVFSTNFPSRWYWTGGAFLRWDWLFYLVASIACLRKDKPILGGAALAYSALLRVFPVFVFMGPGLALGYHVWKKRELHRLYTRFFVGAALASALLIPLSLGVSGGAHAYQRFVQNTAKHKETPLTNYMGLRTVLAYRPSESGMHLKDDKLTDPWVKWKEARTRDWKSARPVYLVLVLGFLYLLLRAGKQVEPWAAAALGVTLIPLGVELTCYYYAFIIGVALLYETREEVGRWLLFLTAFTQFVAWAPLGMSKWLDDQYTLMSLATVAVFALIVWTFSERAAEADAEVAGPTLVPATAGAPSGTASAPTSKPNRKRGKRG